MGRRIPERTRRGALRLWLQGQTFRRVCERLGISLGAMHDIVEGARRKEPDLDDLRKLNITLKKSGVALVDAMRACPVLSRLDELGVGVDQLTTYIDASRKLAEERWVEASELVDATLELVRLRAKTGKSYGEMVRDFEAKLAQVRDMGLRVEALKKERKGLEAELSRARDELRRMVDTKERLGRLGLEKVEAVAEYAEKKETMEKKLAKLRGELRDEKRKLASLRAEVERLWDKMGSLQGRIWKLSRLDDILEKGKTTIACKLCGVEAVFVDIPNHLVAREAMTRGLVWNLRCAHCGQWAQYSAWDVLANIGWLALP